MEKKTMGGFISVLRKAKGLTQQELADRLHVSNKAVSRWERDECAPDISLLPVLAALFEITADELLKGERIPQKNGGTKFSPMSERQLGLLINRAITRFKILIFVSIGAAAAGLLCMLGIGGGFHRPDIGFAVMLLFNVGSAVITIIAITKLNEIKTDAELLENAGASVLDKYNNIVRSYSFAAFFCILSCVLLSLPFMVFMKIPVLILLFFSLRKPYYTLITDSKNALCFNKKVLHFNLVQWAMIAVALAAMYGCVVNMYSPNYTYTFKIISVIVFFVFIAAACGVLLYFAVLEKENRSRIVTAGIRNLLLAADVFLLFTNIRADRVLEMAIIIICVFLLIDSRRHRK